MGYPDYKRDLLAPAFDVNRILDRYFHCGQSVVFTGAPPEDEPKFKDCIACELRDRLNARCHPLQLVVCGSAHLGFSPVPDKLGKPFDPITSDIDVAVVSNELFDSWWDELQSADLDPTVRVRIAEELFWGFINPATVRDVSDIGKKWWELFGGLSTDRAKAIRGRLYRTYWSMQNYHRLAIVKARDRLQGKRV